MIITEDHLECSVCPWVGLEDDAREGSPGYLCPECGAPCAHFPLDEVGTETEPA
jgi:hypothetical protein